MSTPAMRIAGDAGKAIPKRITFTVKAIERLTCPPGKDRLYVYDAKVPGLAHVVTSNGARAFYLIRKVNGRKQRHRLGGAEITIDHARDLATKKNGQIADGIDPSATKRAVRTSDSLQELFDRWEKNHAQERLAVRTRETDKSRFDTCFADWKSRKVLSITESDVRALHAKLGKDRGHVTANRAVQLLRKLFNYARMPHNPAAKAVEMFRERSRKRFVQPAEMPALFGALDDEQTNPLIRDFVYMCLWTGARRSNVQSMADAEIELARGIWTVPGEKTKAGEPIHVPLVPQAVEILRRRMGHASGFIFPSHGKSGHLVESKATWKDVLQRAKLSDLRIHDLRRSLGSYQAALGASLPVIGASLGHTNTAATQIYSRLHLDPVRQSVEAAVTAMAAAGAVKMKKSKKDAKPAETK